MLFPGYLDTHSSFKSCIRGYFDGMLTFFNRVFFSEHDTGMHLWLTAFKSVFWSTILSENGKKCSFDRSIDALQRASIIQSMNQSYI